MLLGGFKLDVQGAGIQNVREDDMMMDKGQVENTRFPNINCVKEKLRQNMSWKS